MGISRLGPLVWEFPTPKTPPLKSPGDEKKVGKKKGHKNHPDQKRHGHCLLRWPAGAKKKIGVEQGEVGRVRWINASSWALPTRLSTNHDPISGPLHSLSPIGFSLGLFLTRVGQVRISVA